MNSLQIAAQGVSNFWKKAKQGDDQLLIILFLAILLFLGSMLVYTLRFVDSGDISQDLRILLGLWSSFGLAGMVCTGYKLGEIISEIDER